MLRLDPQCHTITRSNAAPLLPHATRARAGRPRGRATGFPSPALGLSTLGESLARRRRRIAGRQSCSPCHTLALASYLAGIQWSHRRWSYSQAASIPAAFCPRCPARCARASPVTAHCCSLLESTTWTASLVVGSCPCTCTAYLHKECATAHGQPCHQIS